MAMSWLQLILSIINKTNIPHRASTRFGHLVDPCPVSCLWAVVYGAVGDQQVRLITLTTITQQSASGQCWLCYLTRHCGQDSQFRPDDSEHWATRGDSGLDHWDSSRVDEPNVCLFDSITASHCQSLASLMSSIQSKWVYYLKYR